ncbi:MAG: threonine synthase [Planctomycetota bacterium]|nr:MAG: threonine synthase [Planctomycetota bacterium]
MFATRLECTECGSTRDFGESATVCEACGMPLAVHYDLDAAGEALGRDEYERRPAGLWSLAEVLPLERPDQAVSLGEGGTPLLPVPRLAATLGLADLWVKDESQNPTGSFKARGMSVAVSMAKAFGARALAAPSAGNAGGALAAYGARAGLPVHIAMPEDVPAACRIEAEVCGAHVELLPGTIADCGAWIKERAAAEGWFDISTLKEPYRVEGKKTMGYELALQGGWELPDVVMYPTGGGTGLVGMWKAFHEMRALGWLAEDAKFPRMVVVQAEGCAPVVEAFARGLDATEPPAEPHTLAAGLCVPTPIGDRWMLRVLRESGGTAVSVSDERLLEATRELARTEGMFAAPEGGALVAALRTLLADGRVQSDERVVLFNTGAGVKYLECF